MRRRVYLHGPLREANPDPIEVDAPTVAEVIKILSKQLPAFRPNAKEGYRRIQVVGCDTFESLLSEGPEEIHIIPQFNGGKNGGFFQILIGAALVAASFFLPAAWPALIAKIALQAGVLLMLGGVLQLISQPKKTTQNVSHYLGAPQNTVAIGTPIPTLYGRRLVGGQFLSLNIAAVAV